MEKPVVLCISRDHGLGATRELLLRGLGCAVVSVIGLDDGIQACAECKADLLIIGHSMTAEQKRQIISTFRTSSRAPVLSLLAPGQMKLPEADAGVRGDDYDSLVAAIRGLLPSPNSC